MGCCGQKRSFFTTRLPAVPALPSTPARNIRPVAAAPTSPSVRNVRLAATAPTTVSGATVALRSATSGGIVVHGPATGRHYSFTATTPVQMVEARDAAALLRTSWFRRA